MENATKALLIAAAVLIVILVIALGMKIFNSSSGTATDATKMGKTVSDKTESGTSEMVGLLGEAVNGENIEVINFNKNWYGYVGTNKDKNTVTELLRKIATNNSTNPSRTIYISFISDGTTRGAISSPTTINNIINGTAYKASFANKSSFTVSALGDGNGYINLFRIY